MDETTDPAMTPSDEATGRDDRRPALILAGLAVLGLAAAILLFGGSLLGRDRDASSDEPASLQQIPEFSGAPAGGPLALTEGAGLPQIGDDAGDFTLNDLDGNAVRLSDYRGRPVILNFWATWCGPCRLEMPELEALQQAHQADGLAVLAVNQEETPEQVQAFVEELDLSLTALLDDEGLVGGRFGAYLLPMTVFVDAEGKIGAIHRGIITREQAEEFLQETLSTGT